MTTPANPMVSMLAPDGTPGSIPTERVNDAVKSGFRLGIDLISPDGQAGTVPADKVHDALSAGFKLKNQAPLTEADASNGNFADQQAGQRVSDVAGPPTHILKDGVIQKIGQGVAQSMPGQTAATFLAPPQNPREHVLSAVGDEAGSGAAVLGAYRLAKGMVDSAETMFTGKGTKKNYEQLKQDVVRAAQDYHNHDYRNLASDLVSGTADLGGTITPGSGTSAAERARELSEGARPGGNLTTPLVKDAIDAATLKVGEKAPEIAEAGSDVAGKAAEVVGKVADKTAEVAKNTAEAIKPEWLTKRAPVPAAQHGTPVKVESPLDGPTVGKQLGGKDLSQEALDALQNHIGEQIPVGSTAKNRLTAAVEPVQKTISDGVSKMNDVVKDAPSFTTSIAQDNGLGEGTLTSDLEKMKKGLPASDRAKLSADVDDVLEDADKALNSQDPAELLEERRKLGNRIDWDAIEKNPSTPAEVQNAARARVYRSLTDKIHDEIPATVEIDKTLQPNLELRSHMKSKLGERVIDDPHAATAEAQSEFKKGKTSVENDLHNDSVQKNWQRVKVGLITLGVGGGLIHEIEKFLP